MQQRAATRVLVVSAPVLLDLGAMALVGHTATLRRSRWLCRAARLLAMQRGAEDQRELGLRVVAILDLIARERRGDDQRAVVRQLAREPLEKQCAIVSGQCAR